MRAPIVDEEIKTECERGRERKKKQKKTRIQLPKQTMLGNCYICIVFTRELFVTFSDSVAVL